MDDVCVVAKFGDFVTFQTFLGDGRQLIMVIGKFQIKTFLHVTIVY